MWRKLKTLAGMIMNLATCICYAQSMDLRNPCRDCPVQTLDPWFVVQTMDWPPNPGIACAHSRIAGAQIKAGIDL